MTTEQRAWMQGFNDRLRGVGLFTAGPAADTRAYVEGSKAAQGMTGAPFLLVQSVFESPAPHLAGAL